MLTSEHPNWEERASLGRGSCRHAPFPTPLTCGIPIPTYAPIPTLPQGMGGLLASLSERYSNTQSGGGKRKGGKQSGMSAGGSSDPLCDDAAFEEAQRRMLAGGRQKGKR